MEFLTSEPRLGLPIDPTGPSFPVETLYVLQSSTEEKNKYNCTSTRQYTFMLVSLSGLSALFFSCFNICTKINHFILITIFIFC